ncbi:MAG: ComEC/Rec2 family competence protein [Bacteroidales bacterium]|nr:ComEC/Rec2 family competence protein [Bacteroidales bacterium]
MKNLSRFFEIIDIYAIFRKIPFLKMVIPVIVAILLPLYQYFNIILILSIFITSFSFLLISLKIKSFPYLFELFAFICIYLLVTISQKQITENNKALVTNKPTQFLGVVTEKLKEKLKTFQTTVQIKYFDSNNSWENTSARAIVYIQKDSLRKMPETGSTITFNAYLNAIENFDTISNFDYKKYLASKHIYSSAYISSNNWEIVNTENKLPIKNISEKFQVGIQNKFQNNNYNPSQLAFISALLLGDKTELDKEIKNDFSVAGTLHVLAVSGLHVGIIAIIINTMLSFLDKNKRTKIIKSFIVILSIWSFAYLTGLGASVQRAALMFSIFSLGSVFSKANNTINALFASAFIILLCNPFSFFEIGFQLSYLAVLGIILFYPFLSDWFKQLHKVYQYVPGIIAVSIAAQLFTLPISLYYFGVVPSYSLLANIFAIPLIFIIMSMLLAELFIGLMSSSIALFLADVNKWLIDVLLYLTNQTAHLPHATWQLSTTLSQTLLILACVLVLYTVALYFKKKKIENQVR